MEHLYYKNNIRIFILLCAFLFPALFISAQKNAEPCASAIIHYKLMATNPEYAHRIKTNEQILQQAIAGQNPINNTQSATYKIPVVVHVMHLGEAVGTGTNISDAQIYSAIQALNDAYRKTPGTPYDGNGVDTDIEFCLAQKDPSGNPTTGINRINGTGTGNYENIGISYDSNEVQVKALSFWDNMKYYNIWVVSEIDDNNGGSGTQGYAYYPTGGPFTEDGAVVMYNAFGFDPTGSFGYNLKSYTNLNITLIHELGHGLDLYHTFEGDSTGLICPPNTPGQCSAEGDLVCDIPPHIRSASNCLPDTTTNSCSPGSTAADYQHNYMDYSSDVCQNMFTAGQSVRLTATLTSLRSSLATPSNLAACGCAAADVSIAQTTGTNPFCSGQTIAFTATPSNAGTSPTYQWYLDSIAIPGETGVTYASSTLDSGAVTCVMITSAGTDTVTSNAIIISSNPTVTPVISIALTSGSTSACTGDMLIFTATANNSGTDPVYQWLLNGTTVGADSSIYSSLLPLGTCVVTCKLTSNQACATPPMITSTGITINVAPGPTINYVSNQNICGGSIGATSFSSTPAGANFTWTNSIPSIGLGGSGTGSVPAFTASNGTNSPIIATITVTPSLNNGCQGLASVYTITVNPTPTVLQNGNELITYNLASSYQWFINNQPISGATDQTYTPIQPGSYSVIIDGNPCPSNTLVNYTAGIEQTNSDFLFLVYPNPNDGNFTVSFNTRIKSIYKLELKNALGAVVYKEILTDFNGIYSKPLNLTDYSKGIYMLSIESPNMETIKKVIVY